MSDLDEIEAIKRLKYRYMRCLDQKLWADLATCFTPDATCAYSDGKYSFDGRDAVMGFLESAMPRTMLTSHRVHHPEIDITGPTAATGIWALDDVVIETKGGFTIRGSGFYRDEYRKVDGAWLIHHTGYRRVYEEVQSRAESPSLRLTANMFAGERE
jgi:hypothetical protein